MLGPKERIISMNLTELCSVLDENEARIFIEHRPPPSSRRLHYQYFPNSKNNKSDRFNCGFSIGFDSSPFCCGVTEIGSWSLPEYFRSSEVGVKEVYKNMSLLLEFINLCSVFNSYTFTTLISEMEWVEEELLKHTWKKEIKFKN